jgi:antitoxin VapB
MMNTARIFTSGNSQAVRLPKAFRFDVDQVEIFRRGDEIILKPIPSSATTIYDALAQIPSDIAISRSNDFPQTRESF